MFLSKSMSNKRHTFCSAFSRQYKKEYIIGPDAVCLLEILCEKTDLKPGLTREFADGLPAGMRPYWEPGMFAFYSAVWWRDLWQITGLVEVTCADEIPDGKKIWRRTADFELHDADTEDYLTLVLITAVRK
jgi:hypothetical protein